MKCTWGGSIGSSGCKTDQNCRVWLRCACQNVLGLRKSREMHIVPQRIFMWRCLFEEEKIFLIFGFDAKIVGVCAAWNVACRRIAPPATLQTNFPTKYARAKNTASIIIKRQAGTWFSEFWWFLIKISLIGERQCTKTNVWVFLSGGSGRHDISW